MNTVTISPNLKAKRGVSGNDAGVMNMSARKQAPRVVDDAHGDIRQPGKTRHPTAEQSDATQAELLARKIARLEALEPSEKTFVFGLSNQLAPLGGESSSMLSFVLALGPRDKLEMLGADLRRVGAGPCDLRVLVRKTLP
jgi:hypothetical protein